MTFWKLALSSWPESENETKPAVQTQKSSIELETVTSWDYLFFSKNVPGSLTLASFISFPLSSVLMDLFFGQIWRSSFWPAWRWGHPLGRLHLLSFPLTQWISFCPLHEYGHQRSSLCARPSTDSHLELNTGSIPSDSWIDDEKHDSTLHSIYKLEKSFSSGAFPFQKKNFCWSFTKAYQPEFAYVCICRIL